MKRARIDFPFDRATVTLFVMLTVIIEIICLLARFRFGLQSSVSTAGTVGVWTRGVRIHHGYIGLLIMPLGLMLFRGVRSLGWFILVAGAALITSDLIHHFLVLWPITGSPQFDLTYPPLSG